MHRSFKTFFGALNKHVKDIDAAQQGDQHHEGDYKG